MWDFLSFIVALIAAFVAFYANRKVRAANRRNHEFAEENNTLNARLVALEEEREREKKQSALKASLRCRVEPYNGSFNHLAISNIGQGKASELELRVRGILLQEHSEFGIDRQENLERLKVSIPQNGSLKFRFLKDQADDADGVSDIVLKWINEDGTKDNYPTSV